MLHCCITRFYGLHPLMSALFFILLYMCMCLRQCVDMYMRKSWCAYMDAIIYVKVSEEKDVSSY